jgi:peptide/nickel transport system substrate-binding protein
MVGVLFALTLALAMVLGFAPATLAAEEPVSGGTFSLPITDTPPIYPVKGGLFNILVNKVVYDTLIKYGLKDLELVGGLAESWGVSRDGLAYTFNLRKGVKWHDGAPFSAEDVKFTFDVWMNREVPFYLSANVRNIEKVEVVNAHQARVTMRQPTASFPVLLGYNMGILPKHKLQNLSAKELANPNEFMKNPIGTGPFKFAEKVAGSHVKVVANREYWGGRPHLDAMVFKIVPDIDTQVAQVQAGDMDFAVIEPYQIDAVKSTRGLVISEVEQVNHLYIDFNHLNPIFADKRVRQALTSALNRQAIIEKLMLGKAKLAGGPIAPVLKWAYNPKVKQYPYDTDVANRLLDEAGWIKGADGIRQKGGKRLAFTIEVDPHPIRQGIAVAAQSDWKAVGVETKIDLYEYNVILQHSRNKPPTHDSNPNWLVTPPDPDVSTYYMTGAGGNTSAYSNPKVDALLEKGRSTVSQAERAKAYHELQEIIAEDAPIVYLYYPSEIRLMNSRVKGFPSIGYRDAFAWAHTFWMSR